jgi:hypothetical protein
MRSKINSERKGDGEPFPDANKFLAYFKDIPFRNRSKIEMMSCPVLIISPSESASL